MINNNSEQYLQLLELMDKYTALFKELAPVEERKTAAARDYDLEGLDECMKKEQAFVLQMRGFEKRRENLLKELNLEGTKLSQIPDHCPEELRGRFSDVCRELLATYHLFRSFYDCAAQMVEVRGDKIGQTLARVNSKAAKERTYNAKGKVEQNQSRSMNNKKV